MSNQTNTVIDAISAQQAAVALQGDVPIGRAPETLLGQNLEAAQVVIESLLNDLLDNPKFLGPANPQTGLAEPWRPHGNHMGGIHYELTPGMSLSGNEAQLMHSLNARGRPSILQNGRRLRAGQRYEVEMWAKARHQPVDVQFELRPRPSRQPYYDEARITVDASYWKCYRATLTAPCDDREAVFACTIIGEGALWIDQLHLRPYAEGHLNHRLIEQIGAMNIPVLRFPGGCQSTNYHWRHGTGAVHLRPTLHDPVSKCRACYDFGTDEYLELCLTHGIVPHITVNIGSGTPDEAAQWASYIGAFYRQRGHTSPNAYFQMGNEQYGIWETSHMTGPMYVDALRAFVPPIREAYPQARIIALGEPISYGLRPELDSPWRDVVLDHAGDLFDVIAINRYKGQWNDTDHDRMVNTVCSVPKIEQDLVQLRDACRQRGITATVGLTEWNLWLNAAHWDGRQFYEPFDAQHGLFIAGMIHAMARHAPDVELANFYHLVTCMGIFIPDDGEMIATPGATELFGMYRAALPGDVLPTTVQSPPLGDGDAIDALALDNDEGRWLLLANRSAEASISVSLAGIGEGEPQVVALSSDDPQHRLAPIDLAADDRAIVLPPLTLARLHWPVG